MMSSLKPGEIRRNFITIAHQNKVFFPPNFLDAKYPNIFVFSDCLSDLRVKKLMSMCLHVEEASTWFVYFIYVMILYSYS